MIEKLFPELSHRLGSFDPHQIFAVLLLLAPGILMGLGCAFIAFFIRDNGGSFLTRYLVKENQAYHTLATWTSRLLQSFSGWFIVLTGIYIAIQQMPFMERIDHQSQKLYTFFIFIQMGLIISHLVSRWAVDYNIQHRKTDAARVTMVNSLVRVAYLLIWALMFIFVLDNFGVDVTAMVAGLGVGGLAVAFAFQNILKDIFGSFSIVFDKPFVIGDFIAADDFMGSVEDIGTRTTRLRSLTGELIVISNNDLLGARIRNYGNMYERRVIFNLAVQYGTPATKLEKIPTLIQQYIEAHKDTRFERAHLQKFVDYGLQYEVVYHITKPDYNLMMDIQQDVMLRLYKEFEKQEIRFAVPIQNMMSTLETVPELHAEEARPGKRVRKS